MNSSTVAGVAQGVYTSSDVVVYIELKEEEGQDQDVRWEWTKSDVEPPDLIIGSW